MSKTTPKPQCHNCKHSSEEITNMGGGFVFCLHERYKDEDFTSGKVSAWETLRVLSATCSDHEFKE